MEPKKEKQQQAGVEVAKIEPGEQMPTIRESMELGQVFVESGMFPGITKPAQATAKIMMGREFGIGPVTSLQLIDVVQNRLRPRSQLIAALLKRSKRYDYSIVKMDDSEAIVAFTDRGKVVMESRWTIDDAKRAGLVRPDSGWMKYPKDMLFARALSSGATKVCPEVLGGYEPLEVEGGYDVIDDQATPEGDPPAGDWAGFFAWAKEMGHSPDDVHELLGVESVKDWLAQGKSLAEAEQYINAATATKNADLWDYGNGAPAKQVNADTGEITESGEPLELVADAEEGEVVDAPLDYAGFDVPESAAVSPERLELLRVLLKGSFRKDAKGAVKWLSVQAGRDIAHISQLTPDEVERFIEMQEGIRDRKAGQPLETRKPTPTRLVSW